MVASDKRCSDNAECGKIDNAKCEFHFLRRRTGRIPADGDTEDGEDGEGAEGGRKKKSGKNAKGSTSRRFRTRRKKRQSESLVQGLLDGREEWTNSELNPMRNSI